MSKIAQLFELSRSGETQNVRAMEGLRGFAVALVFLAHYSSLSAPWIAHGSSTAAVMDCVHAIGNAGVDLFFVLSGYLIYGSLIGREQPYARFIQRRIVRIYPAFTAVFLLYLALWLLRPESGKVPHDAVAATRYLAANFLLLPGLFPIQPLITVAWSLSYEMFFYLLLPPVILAFGLRRRGAPWRIAFFLLATAAYMAWCFKFGGHWRLAMFVAGIVLFDVMQHTRLPSPPAALAGGALACALALAPTTLPGPLRLLALFAGFYLTCHACFSVQGNWLARGFSWTPLRWLGNMSYSYYLLHGLTLKIGFMALYKVWPVTAHQAGFCAAMLLPMFVLTLVPSSLLFLLIERPMSLAPALARRNSVPSSALGA